VIDDIFEDRVLDVDLDVETPIQETNAPSYVNESEPEKEETKEDIDGIREPVSGSLLYGNNIISGAIIQSKSI